MKKPILGIRCHKCGRVYYGHALAYGVDADASETIKKAVAEGDDLFIEDADSIVFKLEACKCEADEYLCQFRNESRLG